MTLAQIRTHAVEAARLANMCTSTDADVMAVALATACLATQVIHLTRELERMTARPLVHIEGVPDVFVRWGQG